MVRDQPRIQISNPSGSLILLTITLKSVSRAVAGTPMSLSHRSIQIAKVEAKGVVARRRRQNLQFRHGIAIRQPQPLSFLLHRSVFANHRFLLPGETGLLENAHGCGVALKTAESLADQRHVGVCTRTGCPPARWCTWVSLRPEAQCWSGIPCR